MATGAIDLRRDERGQAVRTMILRRHSRGRRLLVAFDWVERERGRHQRHLLGSFGSQRVSVRVGDGKGRARWARELILVHIIRLGLGELGKLLIQLVIQRLQRIQTGAGLFRSHAWRRRSSLGRPTILSIRFYKWVVVVQKLAAKANNRVNIQCEKKAFSKVQTHRHRNFEQHATRMANEREKGCSSLDLTGLVGWLVVSIDARWAFGKRLKQWEAESWLSFKRYVFAQSPRTLSEWWRCFGHFFKV